MVAGSAVKPVRVMGPAGALALDDGGRGEPPVVLLHSTAGNFTHWNEVLGHLRTRQRAIGFDLRGHGQSDAPRNGDYSMAGLASDVGTVVETLKLSQFVLVGHSLGGGAALTYAGSHPDRVAGLLLLDPIGDGTQISAGEANTFLQALEANYDSVIEGYWNQIAGPQTAVRERLLSDLRATPRQTVIEAFRQVMQFDPRPALARYHGPILSIVTPLNDQSFSLHRLGSGFPHRIVEGTGHWIQLDKPDVVNQLLDEFVSSVSGER